MSTLPKNWDNLSASEQQKWLKESKQPDIPKEGKSKKKKEFKSYWELLTPEQKLHVEVCRYIEAKYPSVYFFHPLNEAKRTTFERFLAGVLRMRSGVADIIIVLPGRLLCIELKAGTGNKQSPNQKTFQSKMLSIGHQYYVCYSYDEAKSVIDTNIL